MIGALATNYIKSVIVGGIVFHIFKYISTMENFNYFLSTSLRLKKSIIYLEMTIVELIITYSSIQSCNNLCK